MGSDWDEDTAVCDLPLRPPAEPAAVIEDRPRDPETGEPIPMPLAARTVTRRRGSPLGRIELVIREG